MPSDFPSRLRAARAKTKLSQAQLAERSGVPVPTIRCLEQGRRPNPQVSTVLALARALGTTVEALFAAGIAAETGNH